MQTTDPCSAAKELDPRTPDFPNRISLHLEESSSQDSRLDSHPRLRTCIWYQEAQWWGINSRNSRSSPINMAMLLNNNGAVSPMATRWLPTCNISSKWWWSTSNSCNQTNGEYKDFHNQWHSKHGSSRPCSNRTSLSNNNKPLPNRSLPSQRCLPAHPHSKRPLRSLCLKVK